MSGLLEIAQEYSFSHRGIDALHTANDVSQPIKGEDKDFRPVTPIIPVQTFQDDGIQRPEEETYLYEEGDLSTHLDNNPPICVIKEEPHPMDTECHIQCRSVQIKEEPLTYEEESLLIKEETLDHEMRTPTAQADSLQSMVIKEESFSSEEEEDDDDDDDDEEEAVPLTMSVYNMLVKEDSAASKPLYSCPVCKRTFSNHGNLSRHRETHKGVKMTCGVCGANFCNKTDLSAHAKEHRAGGASHSSSRVTHSCPVCKRTFKTHADVVRHRKTHKGKVMSCKECGADFCNKTDLAVHTRTHRASGGAEEPHPMECSSPEGRIQCRPVQIKGEPLTQEEGSPMHSDVSTYTDNLVIKEETLDHEMSTSAAHADGLQSMVIKEESFSSEDEDDDEESLPLTMSVYRITGDNTLVKEDSAVSKSSYSCPVCKWTFSNHGNLSRHRETHKGVKMTCGVCGANFCNKMDLSAHAKEHRAGRASHGSSGITHASPVCKRTFNTHADVVRHRKTHKGKVMSCKECGADFCNKTDLAVHTQTHRASSGAEEPHPMECSSPEGRIQCRPVQIKEEPLTHEEGSPVHSDVSTYTDNLVIKEETLDHKMSAPAAHADGLQSLVIKEESFSSEEEEDDDDDEAVPLTMSVYRITGDNTLVKEDAAASKSSYSCPVCKRTFSNHGNLSRHRETHKGVKMTCGVCGANFCNKTDLSAHNKEHRAGRASHGSSGVTHACPVCKRTFNTHADVVRHRETHKGKVMSCKECGADFCNKTDLAGHTRTHRASGGAYRTSDATYSCPVCKRTFNSPGNLKKHCESQKGARASCSLCGADFCNKTDLEAHSRKHRTGKIFPCSKCDRTFPSLSHLAVHKAAHVGQELFACSQCAKQFADEAKLKEHAQVHGARDEYFCNACGESYAQEDELVDHLQLHEQQVTIICSECGLTFADQDELDRHLRFHKLHKPFSCGLCGKQFVHKTELVRHERTHAN